MSKHVIPVKGKYLVSNKFFDIEFEKYHNAPLCGVNLSATPGTEVLALAGGEVVYAGHPTPYLGHTLVIKIGDSLYCRFFHLDSIKVSVGDKVTAGKVVGSFGAGIYNSSIKYTNLSLYTSEEHELWPLRGDQILSSYLDPATYLAEQGLVL